MRIKQEYCCNKPKKKNAIAKVQKTANRFKDETVEHLTRKTQLTIQTLSCSEQC